MYTHQYLVFVCFIRHAIAHTRTTSPLVAVTRRTTTWTTMTSGITEWSGARSQPASQPAVASRPRGLIFNRTTFRIVRQCSASSRVFTSSRAPPPRSPFFPLLNPSNIILRRILIRRNLCCKQIYTSYMLRYECTTHKCKGKCLVEHRSYGRYLITTIVLTFL